MLDETIVAKKRMTFVYGEGASTGEGTSAGEQLDYLAQKIRADNPKLSYERCLELAADERPDLVAEHVSDSGMDHTLRGSTK